MFETGRIYFIALIPAMWCFLSWLLARLSGWSLLAQRFRSPASIEGDSAHMRSARMGVVHYHSLLSFRVNDDGLRIAVAFPIRLAHPPLFIPWTEFHRVTDDSRLYSQKVRASIGRPTIVQMTLPGWVRYRMPLEMRPPNPALRSR